MNCAEKYYLGDSMSIDLINFFGELSKVVDAEVDCVNDLPAILVGIVVAYLTILVSVAIAIFSEKKEFEQLDRNVILDHIVKAKGLIFYLGLTFFPLLFWNASLSYVKLLEILIWAIGLGFITNVLFRSYHWMKGNKFPLRLSYLRDLRNHQDLEEAWRSVWETENINYQNEHEFFKAFKLAVDRSLQGANVNLVTAGKLLGDFSMFLHNRSDSFLLRNEVLCYALILNYNAWVKESRYLEKEDKQEEWALYSELSRITNSIIGTIEAKALSGRCAFSFFKEMQSHINEHKAQIESSQYYAEALLRPFYQIFLDQIYTSPDRHNIWNHYFPSELKVTKSNLENVAVLVSNISLNSYIDWASTRIWDSTENKDFALDDVSKNLFPEVDPIIWARLLIFVFSPYGENRLRSVVERPWSFGFFGRTKVYGSIQKDLIRASYTTEASNTYELAFYIFNDIFSKPNLENYIELLEHLVYQEETVEERKRRALITIFTNMLEFILKTE
jgi:hypothetical protein